MIKSIIYFTFILISLVAHGQTFIQQQQARLSAYYEKKMPIKISVFANQPRYAPGDTIFYSAKVMTAKDLRPIGGRIILHVALYDFQNRLVAQQDIPLKDGYGINQIALPLDLPLGVYQLTAYNEWMRNQDERLFYSKPILIGNNDNAIKENTLKFFPESGTFVAGLSTKIAVTGEPGQSGAIYKKSGEEIASFQLDKFGTGSFYITATQGENYYGKLAGLNHRIDLPEPEADGISIIASMVKSQNSVRATIQLPLQSSHRNKLLHLFVSQHDDIFYSADVTFTNQNFINISLPLKGIPAGICQINILDDNAKPLLERLIFIPPVVPSVSVELNQPAFAIRDKVSMKVKISDSTASQIKGDFGVTVFNEDLIKDHPSLKANIIHELLLYGDLGNELTPFDAILNNDDAVAALDNILISQKWLRFNWDKLNDLNNQHYFNQNISFSGKAVDHNGNPVPDSTLITFFLQKSVMTYQAYTNKNGEFDLTLLLDFFDTDEVYFKAEHQEKRLTDVKITTNSIQAHNFSPVKNFNPKTEQYSAFVKQRSAITHSFLYYAQKPKYEVNLRPNALLEEEIFAPDVIINLADYLLFPTMSETLREIVPMVQHRVIKNRNVIRVFLDESDVFAEESPVYVIDGVMTEDTDYFLSLKPADVVSIKVVNTKDKLRTFGSLGKGCIILVETKIQDNAVNVPRNDKSFTILGLSKPMTPKRIDYSKDKDSRTPDLRTNLAWDPMVSTNDEGETIVTFYTSDVPGNYRIRMQGMTEYGQPFQVEKTFKVGFKSSN